MNFLVQASDVVLMPEKKQLNAVSFYLANIRHSVSGIKKILKSGSVTDCGSGTE
jgi:hypothetical protein